LPVALVKQERASWGEWTRPSQPHVERPAVEAEAAAPAVELVPAEEIDVVEAHWMRRKQ
jgi:hypothetical protein